MVSELLQSVNWMAVGLCAFGIAVIREVGVAWVVGGRRGVPARQVMQERRASQRVATLVSALIVATAVALLIALSSRETLAGRLTMPVLLTVLPVAVTVISELRRRDGRAAVHHALLATWVLASAILLALNQP